MERETVAHSGRPAHRADSASVQVSVIAVVTAVLVAAVTWYVAASRERGALAAFADTWLGADIAAGQGPSPVHVTDPRRQLPAPTPPPGAGGYTLLTERAGGPVRWDPCQPIHYVTSGVEPILGARALLQDAFAQASQATGLRFVDDGPTTETATSRRSAYQPTLYGQRWAPVLVAWTDPTTVPELSDRVIGLGGPRVAFVGGQPRLVSGVLYFDAPQMRQLVSRADVAAVAENVMLHEIGHLVGLDHVSDSTSVMYPDSGDVARYSPGDLRGLALLGSGPCFTTR